MRGSPLLRAFFIIVVLLLMAIPLWQLTHKAEAVMDLSTAPAAVKAPVHIQLTFAHEATGFQVLYLGKVIWEGKEPGLEAQKDFALEFPKEGIDLEIKVEWLPATPETAVRVAVTHNYGSTEQTAWAVKGSLDKVLTFTDPQ
jgi:hypothetical protein